MQRLAVLASGRGTNLEAIIAADLPVTLVLTDRICRALDVAAAHNIPVSLVNRLDYDYSTAINWDRFGFTNAVSYELSRRHIDLVAMAGFMTILSPAIFSQFENRILNTHPSLLPEFKGAHAIPQALAAGVTKTGVTVHIATPVLDSGRILAQVPVSVLSGDTEETLQERIKCIERQLYPRTIRDYLETLKS